MQGLASASHNKYQQSPSSLFRRTLTARLEQVSLCMISTVTHHRTLLSAAGQQRVLRVGIVQVQQGSQALAHNNFSIDQGWDLAARVQCHDLRALVLLCSIMKVVREPTQ